MLLKPKNVHYFEYYSENINTKINVISECEFKYRTGLNIYWYNLALEIFSINLRETSCFLEHKFGPITFPVCERLWRIDFLWISPISESELSSQLYIQWYKYCARHTGPSVSRLQRRKQPRRNFPRYLIKSEVVNCKVESFNTYIFT